MAVNNRAKRVTDPLDANVRARLRGEVTGYASSGSGSGSDHDAAPCLSGLVHAFLLQNPPSSDADAAAAAEDLEEEEEQQQQQQQQQDQEEDDGGAADRAAAAAMRELLDPPAESDPFRIQLAADAASAAAAAAAAAAGEREGAAALRRAVMVRLRAAGYDAGICKARWEGSGGGGGGGGVSAGSYEYIDVVVAPAADVEGARDRARVSRGSRYIVDAEVGAGLEVARATEGYGMVVAAVPGLVVARADAVGRAVRVAAAAARRSLRRRGLHVPPWRKPRYLLAKWLGPYRRTTNPWPSSSSSAAAAAEVVECRAVGFFPADPAGFRLASVAPTR